MDKIKENVMRQLIAILKKYFVECFEKWKEYWDMCVSSLREQLEVTKKPQPPKLKMVQVRDFLFLVM